MTQGSAGIHRRRILELFSILFLLALVIVLVWPEIIRVRQDQRDQRLVTAVQSRDEAAVAAALADGADPNTRIYDSSLSVRQWLTSTVHLNFYQKRYWRPILFRAVNLGDEHIVQFLLNRGADANGRDAYNMYVLPLGTRPRIRMVDLLLHYGLSQANKNEALWVAASHRDVALAKFLIAKGGNVNSQDPLTRIRILEIECLERNGPMVKFLLGHAARPDFRDIQAAKEYGAPDAEIIHLLKRAGA